MQNDGLSPREPFEVSFLLWGLAVGVATLTQIIPAPPAIQATTGRALGEVYWVLLFLVGASGALAGIWWPRKAGVIKTLPLLMEQVGLVCMSGACFIYAAAILVATGPAGTAAAGINLAFAVPALIQGRRIQVRLNSFKSSGHS